jgi:hypothetical protein
VKGQRILLAAELLAFVACLIFGALWLRDPSANWEPAFGLSGLVTIGADLFRRIRARSASTRFPSSRARVQHREAMRKMLQEEIYRCRAEKLRTDVIVRNVERVDTYPRIPDEPGISPWFRVGLMDTYERGIVLCLRIGGLKRVGSGYRYVDYTNSEKSDVTALLMVNVPYDSIAEVNIDGDEYYNFPHIYCHFDFGGEPYERKWFAIRHDQPHGHPYFEKIAEYGDVEKNNPKEGPLYFG